MDCNNLHVHVALSPLENQGQNISSLLSPPPQNIVTLNSLPAMKKKIVIAKDGAQVPKGSSRLIIAIWASLPVLGHSVRRLMLSGTW